MFSRTSPYQPPHPTPRALSLLLLILFPGLALGLVSVAPTTLGAEYEQPNIVLIYVDDMGYGDATCYNADAFVETPAIDSLASGGVRFTNGYVTAPACYPSRVGLLTGAYQARFGCYFNVPGVHVPEEQLVMPEALDEAGYATAVIGKWNDVKYKNTPEPIVDTAEVIMGFASDYWQPLERGVDRDMLDTWGPPEGEEYETDMMTDAAVEFIDSNKDSPFFIYLSYNAPHTPLRALEKYRDDVAHLPSEPERVYAAMLLSIDEGVERVMKKLAEHGLTENTLVVFASDNGPAMGKIKFRGYRDDWPEVLLGSSGPLRGKKFDLLEGGVRVPFIFHYPAKLSAGTVEDRAVSTLDLFPTFCSLAGYTPPEGTVLDGKNLMPYLSAEKAGPIHENLFWAYGNRAIAKAAVRQGDWKLHLDQDNKGGFKVEALYNLAEDIDESDNVAEQNPEVATELKNHYLRWLEAMRPHEGDGTVIDNSDDAHVRTTGDWTTASEAMWEHDKNYLFDGNSGKGEKTVRYDLPLEQAGFYEIQAKWPRRWEDGMTLATQVPVTIGHATGSTTVELNQDLEYTSLANEEWISLDGWYFTPDQAAATFSNQNTDGIVVADAVRIFDWSIDGEVSPRRWRRLYWGDPVPGPEIMSQDPDEDGLINLEEFALGTHPLKADADQVSQNALHLTPVSQGAEGEMVYHSGAPLDLSSPTPLADWAGAEASTDSPDSLVFPDSSASIEGITYHLHHKSDG